MRNLVTSVALVVFLLLSACEQQAELGQPSEYDKNGVKFSLPGNWEVTEDSEEEASRYIFVETPGDAIILIELYAREDSPTLKQYTQWIIQHSVEAFPLGGRTEGTFEEVRRTAGERTLTAYRNEFVASVIGIEVPHVAEFYRLEADARIAYLSWQVATEDLPRVQEGFDLVIASFEFQ